MASPAPPLPTRVKVGYGAAELGLSAVELVDADRLRTGLHREGLYFGVWRTAAKLARALGPLTSGLMLETLGFSPRAETQTSGVDFGLALVFGPGVGVFFIAAALLYLAMPFDERTARRERESLFQANSPNGR